MTRQNVSSPSTQHSSPTPSGSTFKSTNQVHIYSLWEGLGLQPVLSSPSDCRYVMGMVSFRGRDRFSLHFQTGMLLQDQHNSSYLSQSWWPWGIC